MSKKNGNSENGSQAQCRIAKSKKDGKPYAVRIAAAGNNRINLVRGPLNLELKSRAKKIKLPNGITAKDFLEDSKIPIVSKTSQLFKIGFDLLE